MAPLSIDLKIICCKDLKAFNFFQKLSVYATAAIATEDSSTRYQPHKTPADPDGDANPEWNHTAQFDLSQFPSPDLDRLFLEFHFVSQGGLLLGEKPIGRVRVPIRDLLEDSSGAVRYVSYQVVTAEGSPNGVFDFSYKILRDKVDFAPVIMYPSLPEMYPAPPPPVAIYPPPVEASAAAVYPTVETSEAWYPPPEVYYTPPAHFQAGEEGHSLYPPLGSSPPGHFPAVEEGHSFYPPPPSVYPAPPALYGSGYDEYGCGGYPAVDPFRPYNDGTWRNHLQSGGYVGN